MSGGNEFDNNEDSSDDLNIHTENSEDKEKKEKFTYKFPTF